MSTVFAIVSSRLKIHEGAVLVGMLRSHGLAAQMWYLHTAALEGELTFGGVSVMVPSGELEEALQLIMTPVELADQWMRDEGDVPEIYAVKYPDFLSLLKFFVKWCAVGGFVMCFSLPVLLTIAGMSRGLVDQSELGAVLRMSFVLLLGAVVTGVVIAVLGKFAFSLFRQMDRNPIVRTMVAAFFLIVYNPLISLVAMIDLVITGWGED